MTEEVVLESAARKCLFDELCSTCVKRVYIHCDYTHRRTQEPPCKEGREMKKIFESGYSSLKNRAVEAFCYSMNIGFSCNRNCPEGKCHGYNNFIQKLNKK